MREKTVLFFGLSGCLCLLCFCGKGKKEEAFYGPDSLSIAKIRSMMAPGVSQNDSAQIQKTLFRYEIAKMMSKPAGRVDSASVKLARRLTLQDGVEWSPEAASLLLTAAEALEEKLRVLKDMTVVIAFIDSVFLRLDPRNPGKGSRLLGGFAVRDTLDLNDVKFFPRIFSTVFGVSSEDALTLASFVRKGLTEKDSLLDIDKMVKGILSKEAPKSFAPDPKEAAALKEEVTALRKEAAAHDLERVRSENALLALKFRSQESIRDSIARHLPDLEQIYKKQLKLNEMAGGMVWVVFRVDVDGNVLSATIKSSEIANKQFQELLREYVCRIRFKAIPKNMELMIFEFPFEFKAEG